MNLPVSLFLYTFGRVGQHEQQINFSSFPLLADPKQVGHPMESVLGGNYHTNEKTRLGQSDQRQQDSDQRTGNPAAPSLPVDLRRLVAHAARAHGTRRRHLRLAYILDQI